MSTWKELCETYEKAKSGGAYNIYQDEMAYDLLSSFDKIRAVIELARKIDERRCYVEEIIDYPLNDFIDLSGALKDLGVIE